MGGEEKNTIYVLHQDEGVIEGNENLLQYITGFYKKLFGQPDPNIFYFEMEGIPQLDEQDKAFLIQDFNMVELKEVVFSMELNKALGPDGFLVEFYQKF